MTMRSRDELETRRPQIDLSGPEGNVFCLMGYAKKWAKRLGLDGDEIVKDMQSSNYDHAVEVLEKHFGEYVDFYR